MWQIHWIISLIPDAILNWIYIGIIAAGITGVFAGWLARWIPFYGRYSGFLKPLGVLLIIFGVYLKGGYDTEMAWRAKVEELEAKVKIAEEKSQQANEELEKALKAKRKKTKEVQDLIQQRIKENAEKIDSECKVDPSAISILNDAAHNRGGKK